MDITPEYINTVLVGECGQEAMKLSNQVALDIYQNSDTSYLKQESIVQKANICFYSEEKKQRTHFVMNSATTQKRKRSFFQKMKSHKKEVPGLKTFK